MRLFKKLRSRKGFVVIVGMGIVLVMGYYGLLLEESNINALQNIKMWNNVYSAQDATDSVMEYMLFVLKKHPVGYNLTENCEYTADAGAVQGSSAFCTDFFKGMQSAGKNIKVSLELKGHLKAEEMFNGGCPGISGKCYVAPFPGTGTGSDRCDMYSSQFGKSGDMLVNGNGLVQAEGKPTVEGVDVIKQIDHSCNWDKLTFGGSMLDRAAIPFYYDDGTGLTVSPFNEATDPAFQAKEFVLRMRTPCLPCVYDSSKVVSGVNRFCKKGQDPTICKETERYVIDETKNDIVVQWQITGKCDEGGKEVECGMIQYAEYTDGKKTKIMPYFSGISKARINQKTFSLYNPAGYLISDAQDSIHKLLYKTLSCYDTTTYLDSTISLLLPTMKNPILALFLSGPLKTPQGKNVPYLEYQVLTDKPIGNPKTKMTATTIYETNASTKTLYKEVQKPLIDFAIQN